MDLPVSRSKNKSERTTPLVGMARAIVERALEGHKRGPLFRAALKERPLTASDVGHALKKRTLPCDHFSSHDLRRTVVSIMDEMGMALDTIAAVVGHQRGSKDTRTLVRHYSRPRLDERIEAALTAWDARLRDIIEGPRGTANSNVVRLHDITSSAGIGRPSDKPEAPPVSLRPMVQSRGARHGDYGAAEFLQ